MKLEFKEIKEGILAYNAKSEYQQAAIVIIRGIFKEAEAKQSSITAVGCCKEQLKCDACKGTGTVEGEHYDDLQSCNNCLGKGTL